MPRQPSSQGVQDRAVLARLDDLSRRVDGVAGDAREARDGVLKIDATMAEQKVGVRIAELTAQVEAHAAEARSDLVNAISHARTEHNELIAKANERIDGLDRRVKTIEELREETKGRLSVFGWLANHAAWIAVALAWAAAFIGLHPKP